MRPARWAASAGGEARRRWRRLGPGRSSPQVRKWDGSVAGAAPEEGGGCGDPGDCSPGAARGQHAPRRGDLQRRHVLRARILRAWGDRHARSSRGRGV